MQKSDWRGVLAAIALLVLGVLVLKKVFVPPQALSYGMYAVSILLALYVLWRVQWHAAATYVLALIATFLFVGWYFPADIAAEPTSRNMTTLDLAAGIFFPAASLISLIFLLPRVPPRTERARRA